MQRLARPGVVGPHLLAHLRRADGLLTGGGGHLHRVCGAIARQRIRRQEHTHRRVIVPGVVVVQSGQRVVVLPSEAFSRVKGSSGITDIAVGPVELVALFSNQA